MRSYKNHLINKYCKERAKSWKLIKQKEHKLN